MNRNSMYPKVNTKLYSVLIRIVQCCYAPDTAQNIEDKPLYGMQSGFSVRNT